MRIISYILITLSGNHNLVKGKERKYPYYFTCRWRKCNIADHKIDQTQIQSDGRQIDIWNISNAILDKCMGGNIECLECELEKSIQSHRVTWKYWTSPKRTSARCAELRQKKNGRALLAQSENEISPSQCGRIIKQSTPMVRVDAWYWFLPQISTYHDQFVVIVNIHQL